MIPRVASRSPGKHLAVICLVIASAGLQRVAALDTKWETCGLEGLWFHDKVLAKGLEDNNRKLVECALTAKKDFAPISNNRFCKDNNCIFSAKDDAMIDFMISKARKEQLAEKDKSHGSIYTVLSNRYIPGKNDKLMKKWIQKISRLGISAEEAQDMACRKGDRDLYLLLGKQKTTEGKFSLGQEVRVKLYDFGGKIHTLCKDGATYLEKGSTYPRFQSYSEMLTVDEKKAEDQRFAESRRLNEAKRAAKKNGSSQPHTTTTVDDRKRDKRYDIPAGTIVRVPGKSIHETTHAPGPLAICESKTLLRRMANGYWIGTVHCGGSAVYEYTVGAEIERVKKEEPAEPSYQFKRCKEDCLKKCPRIGPGEYQATWSGSDRCTSGCDGACASWK